MQRPQPIISGSSGSSSRANGKVELLPDRCATKTATWVKEIVQRMAGAELKLDRLEHDLGRLRRESPQETRYGPR